MLTPIINLSDYDLVVFRDNEIQQKVRAYRVNEYLAVTYNGFQTTCYKIYSLITGKPAIDLEFVTVEDAISFAEWISEVYKEYLCIWEAFPDANLVEISKWSIKNGVDIAEIIKSLPHKPLLLNQVECLKEY
jgi:hypothetical protein